MLVVVVMLFVSSCGINNPIQQAETVEQKALATYGSYVIVKEQAAKLYIDPATPESVKQTLKEANDVVRDPINSMYEAAIFVKTVQDELAAGKSTEEQLIIATQSLLEWYLLARPLYESFNEEYRRVRN
jgi:hypothetical protein